MKSYKKKSKESLKAACVVMCLRPKAEGSPQKGKATMEWGQLCRRCNKDVNRKELYVFLF